jgi:hypothetical protein
MTDLALVYTLVDDEHSSIEMYIERVLMRSMVVSIGSEEEERILSEFKALLDTDETVEVLSFDQCILRGSKES